MYFETIAAKDVENFIGKNDIVIVDLRDNKNYKNGHIATAINIPFQALRDRNYEISRYQIDVKNEIIFYCDRGGTSLLVCREVCKLGYKVKNVCGGIRAYRGKLDK